MSGRKQHYIPQFVLRSFGERGSGKKTHVRVSTRDKIFLASTEGVAAQREFYSNLTDYPGHLDDVITESEIEYAKIFSDLIDAPAGLYADSLAVSRLATHLAVRGSYMRDALSTFGHYAVSRIREAMSSPDFYIKVLGLHSSEPSDYLRERLDELYNEKKQMYAKARVSRFEFRKIGFNLAKDRWGELYDKGNLVAISLDQGLDFSKIVEDAHKNVLSKDIEPAERVGVLQKFEWEIRDYETPKLSLPDCVALANYPDIGPMPLGFVGKNDLQGVFFPVSPTRAICGGIYRSPQVADALADGFGLISAAASWDFVVSPPSYPLDFVPKDRIGDSIINTMYEAVEKSAVGEFLGGAL